MGVAVAKSSGVVARGFRRHERNGAWGAAKEGLGTAPTGGNPSLALSAAFSACAHCAAYVRCSFARSSSRTRRASVWSCARFRERDAAADARFLRRRASRADSVPDGSEASEDAFVSSRAQTASLSPAVSSEREPRCEREARGSFRANLCWGSGKRGKRSNAANEASSAAKCAASPASSRGGVDGETRAPWREPREVRAEARRGEAFSAAETRRATRREGRDGDAMVAPSSSRGPETASRASPASRSNANAGGSASAAPASSHAQIPDRSTSASSKSCASVDGNAASAPSPPFEGGASNASSPSRNARRDGSGGGAGTAAAAVIVETREERRARGREEGRRGPRGARRASASGALGAAEMRRFPGTISTPGVFRGDVDWPISGRRFVRGREPPKRPIQ